jgi:hypothetical protein
VNKECFSRKHINSLGNILIFGDLITNSLNPKQSNMDSANTNLFELQIDASAQSYLREAAKWARFLSIVGFIFCALFILFGIFAGSIFSTMGAQLGTTMAAGMGTVMAVVYVCLALLYFFPCLYTYRFGTQMQSALASNDQQVLISSFRNLKACYKFLGVLTIVMLSFYLLALVFGGLGAMMSR